MFVDPDNITDEDRKVALEALAQATTMLKTKGCQMLILDEVNVAISYGLVSLKDVLKLIEARAAGVELVLTGRDAPAELIEMADYVSVIESPKHPYQKGTDARRGVEY
jgi:cob(I)alamin adenosyltransferase